MDLKDFYNLHSGQTCLIVGVGDNLRLTPPEWFGYPSFGVNTIYKYEGWEPTYFVGVDERLRLEDGAAIVEKYADIPKFFPRPDWDELQGENIYRFAHRTGGELSIGGQSARDPDALTRKGLNYRRIMDAVLQIAWHMGFTTMLMIGIQHKPGERRAHFWGQDMTQPADDFRFEESGYAHFVRGMGGVRVLNISEDTYVHEDALPRGDWQDWVNRQTYTKAPEYSAATVTG